MLQSNYKNKIKKLSEVAILKRKGYVINKKDIEPELLQYIKSILSIKPNAHKDFSKFVQKIPAYHENTTKIFLPRHWGLDNIGKPHKNCIKKGEKFTLKLKTVYPPRDYQMPIIDKTMEQLNERKGGIITIGCGGGKCHKKDTPILMYDGSIKMVQDIKVGDQLMGDDSTPRNVLTLARGREMMYKIIPKRGTPYVVNESHILSLKYSTNKGKHKKGEILDIPLTKYLKLSKMYHGRGSPLVGYKVPVEFNKKEVEMDPYIIGLWLGDGTSSSSGIATQDHRIIKYLYENLSKYNMWLSYTNKYDYRIVNHNHKKCNLFTRILRKYNLLNNKHIPQEYKCNSRENRLKLLAGLIDTDGYMHNNMYSIIQKNEKLIDDIVYLSLSLGFYAEKKEVWKRCTNSINNELRKYFTTQITGFGIEEIPVLIDRKKCGKRKQIKNPLHSLISVEKLQVDDYYGFTLDGNHRYLLGDFTVTHNTYVSIYLSTLLKQKTLIVVHTTVLLNQWVERINEFVPEAKVGIIKGKKFDIEDKDFVIAMLQTIISESREFTSKTFSSFGTTIFDECFPFNTAIKTENGYKLIGTLYEMWKNNKELPKVLSFNQNTCKFEYKKITYAWEKKRSDMIKIKASKKVIKCTPEHKILTNKGYVKACLLKESDLLASYNYKKYDFTKVDYITNYIHTGNNNQTEPYVYDIEVEDNHNFIVCGGKDCSDTNQGIIVSNCHHMAAPTFSRAIPIVNTKYTIGLSATPERADKLENIFYWHIGPSSWYDKKRDGQKAIVKVVNYENSQFEEKKRWNGGYDLVKMIEQIIENENRNNFIIKQIQNLSVTGRQILVLSSRKSHLTFLYDTFKEFNLKKKDDIDVTCGMYVGGMKQKDLDISATCDVIFATYQLVSEGTDIPTLNTLIMASPKKMVEQVVGRILRAKTEFNPLVIDIADVFSVYTNQARVRNRFYKKQLYYIEKITYNSTNEIPNIDDSQKLNIKEVMKKCKRKKKEKVIKKEEQEEYNDLMIDFSD
jgi:superfamily II DNA or RNA helicase/predicted GIY-YIG superfamily endonuclease